MSVLVFRPTGPLSLEAWQLPDYPTALKSGTKIVGGHEALSDGSDTTYARIVDTSFAESDTYGQAIVVLGGFSCGLTPEQVLAIDPYRIRNIRFYWRAIPDDPLPASQNNPGQQGYALLHLVLQEVLSGVPAMDPFNWAGFLLLNTDIPTPTGIVGAQDYLHSFAGQYASLQETAAASGESFDAYVPILLAILRVMAHPRHGLSLQSYAINNTEGPSASIDLLEYRVEIELTDPEAIVARPKPVRLYPRQDDRGI